MLVQRSWKPIQNKLSQISNTNVLDIWDSGDIRVERWPDGTEYCWSVQSIELQEDQSFIEILKERELWEVPAQVLWKEQIPLLAQSVNSFQLPGWQVSQKQIPQKQIPQKILVQKELPLNLKQTQESPLFVQKVNSVQQRRLPSSQRPRQPIRSQPSHLQDSVPPLSQPHPSQSLQLKKKSHSEKQLLK